MPRGPKNLQGNQSGFRAAILKRLGRLEKDLAKSNEAVKRVFTEGGKAEDIGEAFQSNPFTAFGTLGIRVRGVNTEILLPGLRQSMRGQQLPREHGKAPLGNVPLSVANRFQNKIRKGSLTKEGRPAHSTDKVFKEKIEAALKLKNTKRGAIVFDKVSKVDGDIFAAFKDALASKGIKSILSEEGIILEQIGTGKVIERIIINKGTSPKELQKMLDLITFSLKKPPL
jgi:hypothetical protein